MGSRETCRAVRQALRRTSEGRCCTKKRDEDTGLNFQKLTCEGWEEAEAPVEETEKGDGEEGGKLGGSGAGEAARS